MGELKKKTRKQRTSGKARLLAVLLNPELQDLTIDEKCKEAEISRPTYYQIINKPGFKEEFNDLSKGMAEKYAPDIIKRAIYDALNGKYQQQRMILEMAGYINNDTVVNHIHTKSKDQLIGDILNMSKEGNQEIIVIDDTEDVE